MADARRGWKHAGWCLVAVLLIPLFTGCLQDDPPLEDGEAPRWREGDIWRYDVMNKTGAVVGYRTYQVLGEGTFDPYGPQEDEVEVYRMAVEIFRPDNQTYTSQRVYKQTNLHHTSATCNEEEGGSAIGCPSWDQRLDLPLWDGKTWRYFASGDDVQALFLEAERIPQANDTLWNGSGPLWQITVQTNQTAKAPYQIIYYDDEVGFMVELVQFSKGEIRHRWVLTEWSYANGSSGTPNVSDTATSGSGSGS